jgi:hypothetical protein
MLSPARGRDVDPAQAQKGLRYEGVARHLFTLSIPDDFLR